MFEDIASVLTWALCGGILVSVILVWLFVFLHLLWISVRKPQRGQ
jgi:hypothetical protein